MRGWMRSHEERESSYTWNKFEELLVFHREG